MILGTFRAFNGVIELLGKKVNNAQKDDNSCALRHKELLVELLIKNAVQGSNLIEVKACCGIPERIQLHSHKKGFLACLPCDRVNGPSIKVPLQSGIRCLPESQICCYLIFTSTDRPEQAVKLFPLPDHLVDPVPLPLQAEPPHHPRRVEHAEEPPSYPGSLGPERFKKAVAHQSQKQPVTPLLSHPARILAQTLKGQPPMSPGCCRCG